MNRRSAAVSASFAGYRFPPEVILLAVRWYLRYGLSCRDVEELLAERGIEVDHVTIYRWVQRFTPILIDAARPCRHAVGNRLTGLCIVCCGAGFWLAYRRRGLLVPYQFPVTILLVTTPATAPLRGRLKWSPTGFTTRRDPKRQPQI